MWFAEMVVGARLIWHPILDQLIDEIRLGRHGCRLRLWLHHVVRTVASARKQFVVVVVHRILIVVKHFQIVAVGCAQHGESIVARCRRVVSVVNELWLHMRLRLMLWLWWLIVVHRWLMMTIVGCDECIWSI